LNPARDDNARLVTESLPAGKRDAVSQRMETMLTEIASEAGCRHEMAREFDAAMEQTIREYVAEIEARDGGTTGTA
jgi:hypothetical protein